MVGLLFSRWRVLAAAVAGVLPLLAMPATQSQAAAPTTVVRVIHLEGEPIDNRCNGDATVLHGDLTVIATHVPTSDGGEIVQGTSITTNLVGSGLPSGLTYTAAEAEISFAHYVPPPGTGFTATDVHFWRLVPNGDPPAMYLATVIHETVENDGTTSVHLKKTYLICA
jgi:hypothetical protein